MFSFLLLLLLWLLLSPDMPGGSTQRVHTRVGPVLVPPGLLALLSCCRWRVEDAGVVVPFSCVCLPLPTVSGRVASGLSPYGVVVSGRMASGLSPYGVASFVHARLGVRGYQGRMVSNLPSPCPSTCYRCPDGALWWLASARTKRPTMGFSLIGALPAFEPRRQGGRECAVRYWIQHALGWACTGLEAVPVLTPPKARVPDRGCAAGAVI